MQNHSKRTAFGKKKFAENTHSALFFSRGRWYNRNAMKYEVIARGHKNAYQRWIAALLAALLLSVACDFAAIAPQSASIVINEVVTSNGDSLEDDAYGSPDWIELRNIGNSPVSLLGYRITDNIQKAEKAFVLPDITLAPGECVLLYATKDAETDLLSYEGGPVCIGFALKSTGENLALEDANMQLVQELTVPALDRDVSYARRKDGSYGFCGEPTPNAENEEAAIYSNLADVPNREPEEELPKVTSVTGLYFSEISARNNLAVECAGGAECDWIELYNETDAPIVLDGFTLADKEKDNDLMNLTGTVPAGGYLVILCCGEDCENTDGHVCVRMGVSRYGDTLYLFDAEGLQCAFAEIPETPAKDVTYMRDASGAYAFTATGTPGEPNVYTEYVPPVEEEKDDEDDDAPDAVFTGLQTAVIINEVLPSNGYSIADRDGDRNDWVELYNPGDAAVNLEGWYLSDANKNLMKWAFPAVSIPAKGYLLVFLDGKESNESELHANFSLTAGETVKLYNSADNTYDAVTVAVSRSNVSIGRDSEGAAVYYWEPTPLAPNGHARYEADSFGFFQSDGVLISEVSAIHERGSNEDDWIELYNGGNEAVRLDGYYLTDDIDEPTKYCIGSLTLEAGEYAAATVNKYAGNFSISPSGETLFLLQPDGKTVVDVFETGVQRVGMTSGRIVDDPSVRRVFFSKATRGKKNGDSYETGYTSEPTFSETALYWTMPFLLTLSSLQSDATIYYTTDGSEPTTKSKVYKEPITISKNTVIRAYAVSDGLMDSEIITYTYLFEDPHTLPVVCISMAPNDLKAVWNVKLHSEIKERKGFVTYYESDGLVGTSFPCDIKAKGQGTLKYISQKSLTLGLRAEYGQRTVSYPFWDDYPYTEFGAFALRQAGQDYDLARMRDAFISRASLGLNVDTANSRFCVVYINGSYYGIYDFNEELNSRYLETHYGVDPDTVNTIMRNGAVARKGDTTEWKKVFNNAKNAKLNTQEKYDTFCEKVDDEMFIDYIIVRTFMRDSDMFNQKYWRTTDYQLKWRPILYDMDYALNTSAPNGNMMHSYFKKDGVPSANGSLTYFYLSCALRTNDDWCDRFVERYVEVVMTYFTAERLTALIDQMEAELAPEMQRHIDRWKNPSSYSKWQNEVKKLKEVVVHRTEIILDQVRKEFNLSQSEMDALIAKYDG